MFTYWRHRRWTARHPSVGLAVLLIASASSSLAGQTASRSGAASEAVGHFLDAASPLERDGRITEIEGQGFTFAEVLSALRAGRTYREDVPRGRVAGARLDERGVRFPYFIQVPRSYTPERRYPVRVYLHGGIMHAAWEESDAGSWWRAPERLESEDYIGVFPAAWEFRRWWQDSQLENLREVLRAVRRDYNVDENRVSLTGVSDGGTGTWWVAFRDTTPWASFLPFIGHPVVLMNPAVSAEGEIFRANLTNKPFYVVNGEEDRLYPASSVDPFIMEFAGAGVLIDYRPKRGYGHETGWWPEEAPRIDAFVEAYPRDPHPRCIAWQTESVWIANRAHWIRIDSLGPTPPDAEFEPSPLLDTPVPSGRLDARRDGNEVEMRSSGVRQATLLLSPDAFDLAHPIRVRWNGTVVFDGSVQPDVGTLLRWAARDDDRTMQYAAELHLDAPATGNANEQYTGNTAAACGG